MLKGALRSAVVVALLTFGVTGALAEPVQQFSVQLKNVKSDGRYSVVYTSNSFDTTGDAPPALSEAFLRLAKGMTIKPEFLRPSRLCDTAKFAGYLFQKLPAGTTYAQRVDAFPQGASRASRSRCTTGARDIVETCRGAFLGRGTATVDARPLYPDPIPARFSLFLTKPTAKGAIAGIGVVSHYDRTSPIALDQPRYIYLAPIFTLNVFNDADARRAVRLQDPAADRARRRLPLQRRRPARREPRAHAQGQVLGDPADMPEVRRGAVPRGLRLRGRPPQQHAREGAVPALHALTYQCTPFIRFAIAICSIEAFSSGSFSPFEAAESGKTL